MLQFQYLEMHTDSAYMALAGNSLEELVQPNKKEDFTAAKHQWFPRHDTPENASRASSKWNGKEMVLWASIVRLIAAEARRATKPAAKASARN